MGITLAIDQSTSATKAILFAQDGAILGKESLEHRQIYPEPGWVEHDAEEIWRNLLSAVRKLLEKHRASIPEIVRVSITNQRETVLAFDAETGKPEANAIVWQCRRGDAFCETLRAAGHEALVQEKTGLRIDTYFPASKMRWMSEHVPGLSGRLASGAARFGTMDTYLVHRLTRGAVFATDATNASRTLLYDISALNWDPALCDLFQVPMASLAEVREPTACFGETTFDGLLEKPLPIQGVAGDSHASLFAQGCVQAGSAKVTLGTGSSLLLNTGAARPRDARNVLTSLAWTHDARPTYALEGLINYSAATIHWLRDQLGLIGNPEETERMARELEDNGGVYLVPAFAGLSAPYWSADARAAILGMTGHTDKRYIARAALESIAYQIRDVLDDLQENGAVALETLSADGGAINNTFLMQFLADLLRIPVRAAAAPEFSALGAVRLGAWGAGEAPEAGGGETEAKVYTPAANDAEMARYYEGWKAAVRRVL